MHRAMRLFQSPTPPCPFCAHGVVPTSGQANAPVVQTSRVDFFKQRALPTLPPYANQQAQQQQQGYQSQRPYDGSVSWEPAHQCNTFPSLVTSQTVAWPCMSSEKSGSTHGDKFTVKERGTVDYPGYLLQPQQQGFTSRPPPGIYPPQAAAVSSNIQQRVIHPSNTKQNLALDGTVGAHHDSNDFATVNRAEMTNPTTGAWRENLMGSEYDWKRVPFAQSKVTPLRLHQKRRDLRVFQTSNVSVGGRSHTSYGGGGSSHGSHGMHAKLSPALSLPILPNLPPAVPPEVPRTEAIQWAVIRLTNVRSLLICSLPGCFGFLG